MAVVWRVAFISLVHQFTTRRLELPVVGSNSKRLNLSHHERKQKTSPDGLDII